ncbi:MAG: GYD domain-containing protein [Candidatus Limnocylindrales bacterium]
MPKYLITGSYTVQGAKGVIAEGGSGRVAAVKKLAESLGGSVESFYFAFGGDDFFVTVDLPGNAAAAACAMSVAGSGGASPRTVVLLTPDEVDAAMKLSPSYRAPGA